MNFSEFSKEVTISIEEISRGFYLNNRDAIKIKKEAVAVKNIASILGATIKLSNEKGFQSMSLRDLCGESGLSMGALYSYITSKDELFKVIHVHGMNMVGDILNGMITRETAPAQRLDRAVRTHLYLSEMMQQWFYFLYMETKNLRKEDRKIPLESEIYTEKIFIDIIAQGIKEGSFAQVDTVLTGSIIKAMLQDWYLKRWKYSKRKITVDGYADFILGMLSAHLSKGRKGA